MIRPTDINTVLQWDSLPVQKLGEYLHSEGFKFAKQFSTDEIRYFLSDNGQYMIVLVKDLGKVYRTDNQKKALHMFSVVR